MKAIQAARPGGPSVLRLCELDTPEPGQGQLLVQVQAAGVNFIDTYRRSGVYAGKFPHVPGSEGAGLVQRVGPGATSAVGERVMWVESVTGSYAEYAIVDQAAAVPVPEYYDLTMAASVALQGLTADYLVQDTFPVGPSHTVAFYAAAGGVGQLATQMILAKGARLIAVVGSATKTEKVAALGVPPEDIIVLGAMSDVGRQLPTKLRALTDGAGVDVVYDSIGADTFMASLASVKPRGMVVLFGGSSGQVQPFDPQELNAHGSIYLTRPKLGDYTATHQELTIRANRVLRAVGEGRLAVSPSLVLPLDQAAEAHRDLESRSTTGKIVLTP
ncbi:MAG: quinone oxidoreductase [Micrococcales bacterium]|nr:quinone oxidoreductase [Micrococcales bacterium]